MPTDDAATLAALRTVPRHWRRERDKPNKFYTDAEIIDKVLIEFDSLYAIAERALARVQLQRLVRPDEIPHDVALRSA